MAESMELCTIDGIPLGNPEPKPDKSREELRKERFIPASVPYHQSDLQGVMYDFTYGARVMLVKDSGQTKKLHCIISDEDMGIVLLDAALKEGVCLCTVKKYYIRYRVDVFDEETRERLWGTVMDLEDRDVLINMPYKGAVGDSIAWFSFVERFQRKHKARIHVLLPPHIREMFEPSYPDITFETPESANAKPMYAVYYMGLYFGGDVDWQPVDFRLVGLAETAGRILGLEDLSEQPPRVRFGSSRVDGKYVVVATQASNHAKHWCNPFGWYQLVKYLTKCGYKVVCIDREPVVPGPPDSGVVHAIPNGCVDMTGTWPLSERVNVIHHADFFVGLSSGLSWVAWCCDVPVVLISGICMPFGEFHTPYRVQSYHSCHGCWNDTRCEFSHTDFMWCPRHKGTPRAYECTTTITAKAVADTIARIPGTLCTGKSFIEVMDSEIPKVDPAG